MLKQIDGLSQLELFWAAFGDCLGCHTSSWEGTVGLSSSGA